MRNQQTALNFTIGLLLAIIVAMVIGCIIPAIIADISTNGWLW